MITVTYFRSRNNMNKKPITFFDANYSNKTQVVWILKGPTFLAGIRLIDEWIFVKQYLKYLSKMDMETLITDDIGNIIVHIILKNELKHESLAHLKCYKAAVMLSRTTKETNNRELWITFTQNFEIAYKNSSLPDSIADSMTFTRIARKILCDMFKNSEIKTIYTNIERKTGLIKDTLKQIYSKLNRKKREVEIANDWLHWEKTSFKQPIRNNVLKQCIGWYNKYKFIEYHARFFKNLTIENIIRYEIGAKLILYLINKPSFREDEMSKQLKFSILCIEMINNSKGVQNEYTYFECFKELRKDMWIKYGETMSSHIRNKEYTSLNKHLYKFLDEQIALISNNPNMVQLIETVWSGTYIVKFYLGIIYDEFINK